jgi:YQGE family putative transporter
LRLPWSTLSPPARRGLLAHGLHWQAVQIGQLYVAVYLFRVSHGYALPALHAFCSYVMVPVGYWFGGMLARAKGSSSSYRLGIGVYALYQALIVALGSSAAQWAGLLGALWGLGVGCYWQSWVLLMVDLSDEGKDRDAMLAANQSVFFVASFTGAPLAGWFLARFSGTQGYPWAFGASFSLFVLAWLVSLGVRGKAQHVSGALGRLLSVRKPRGWHAMLASALLMGFLSVGTMFLPMLIAYESGGSEGYGGSYAAWTALAGFGVTALMARAGHPEKRGGFVFWAGLAVTALILPLAFSRAYGLVLLYGLGMAVASSGFNVPLFAAHIRIVEADPRFRHRRADAMFMREVPLNFGRVLACGIVLWGVKDLRSGALTGLLLLLAAVPLLNYRVLRPWLGAPPAAAK